MPDFTHANLNLLVALDALLSEAHVSRAAKKLGVSQSAMSHSLRQLREWLDDPLLVRGHAGLVRTPRAERIRGSLRRGLAELERGLQEPVFAPETSDRSFAVAAPDHLALHAVPQLFNRVHARAPRVDLVVRPLDPRRYVEQLELAELDVAIAVSPPLVSGLRQRSIGCEDFLCVVRRGHPTIKRRPTLAQYARALHVVHSPAGAGPSRIDELLAARGHQRRVALRIPSMLAAPLIVAQSDLLLTAPRSLAEAFGQTLALSTFAPPVELGRLEVQLLWHERFDRDPANVWLRDTVLAAARGGALAPR